MNSFDHAYNQVLEHILEYGVEKDDRTGTGTISRFGTQARFSLEHNRIPLISTRKIFHRSFIHETLWFLSGSTDIQYLKENNVSIWDNWVKPGTERYRDMTQDEIKSTLVKYFEMSADIGLREFFDIAFPEEDTLAEDDLELEGWQKAYRLAAIHKMKKLITDVELKYGWKEVVFKHATWPRPEHALHAFWAIEAAVGSDIREVIYTDVTQLQDACLDIAGELVDIEPRVLTGGSIGDGAYGSQWRSWDDTRIVSPFEVEQYINRGFEPEGFLTGKAIRCVVSRKIDQITNIVNQLKTNPDSRRILLVAFNPSRVDECQLPPCHSFVQWWTRELSVLERSKYLTPEDWKQYVTEMDEAKIQTTDIIDSFLHGKMDGHGIPRRALSCMLTMRSSDFPVGASFNIPQYAMLTHMFAHLTGMVAEELIFSAGDTHIYANQWEGVEELLSREGHEEEARLVIKRKVDNIDDFKFEDFEIVNYKHDPVIKFPIAV